MQPSNLTAHAAGEIDPLTNDTVRSASDSHMPVSTPAVGGRIKRTFDIAFAAACLTILAPIIGAAALAVRLQDGGPPIYGHWRIGHGGRPFRCLKLRTMAIDADEALERHLRDNPEAAAEWDATRKLKDDPRVTALGRFLRKSSLDELPQFINVLRGEMSVVGPRPIVEAELSHYGPHGTLYLGVRPGMTGAWQVSGRNDVSYRTRVALDAHYIGGWSLGRDLLIVVRTIPAILRARGTY